MLLMVVSVVSAGKEGLWLMVVSVVVVAFGKGVGFIGCYKGLRCRQRKIVVNDCYCCCETVVVR